jgi:hypothetical protein
MCMKTFKLFILTLLVQLKLTTLTDWFLTKCRVKQCDTLSSTLFGIYLNDIASEVNTHNVGNDGGGRNVHIFLYADDIVLFNLKKC